MSEKMELIILVTLRAHLSETLLSYKGTSSIFLGLCAYQQLLF
jgi:hypothetical protein